MQCSVIGNLADASMFVDAVARNEQHGIAVVCAHGPLMEQLAQCFPDGARRAAVAEDGLYADNVEVVIIAEADPDEAMALARQASQSDRHVVVIPPPDASTAFSYELHLLLDESQFGIVVLSGRWYLPDDLGEIASDVRDVEFGLPCPADDPDHRATLLYAIDQTAAMGFATSQVTALDLSGSAELPARRQIVFAESPRVTTTRPGLTINCSNTVESFRIRSLSSESPDRILTVPARNERLADEESSVLCQRVMQSLTQPGLSEAMEAFSETLQLRKAVDDSIRRRRTIDIYLDGLTERSAFKTQMTAMGCGVLTWLMFGMVAFLLVGQLNPPPSVLHVLRAIWIAPVVLFLAAQFLLPLARGRMDESSAVSSSRSMDS